MKRYRLTCNINHEIIEQGDMVQDGSHLAHGYKRL